MTAVKPYREMYNNLYELIISDIMMPEIDGFEFAENVRRVNKTIPILFMSAKDDLPAGLFPYPHPRIHPWAAPLRMFYWDRTTACMWCWINKTIPILFMSAKDDLPSKQKGFQLGIDDYMVKPKRREKSTERKMAVSYFFHFSTALYPSPRIVLNSNPSHPDSLSLNFVI